MLSVKFHVSMNNEDIYSRLPIPLQNLACSIYGYRISRQRYNYDYRQIEKDVIEREYWSNEKLKNYKNKKIKNMVAFAYQYVPYYQKLFKQLSLAPQDITTGEALTALVPVLEKNTVQQKTNEFIPTCLNEIKHSVVKTSGTTGKGLVFPFSMDTEREQWAVWWRYRSRFGLNRNTWYAHFYGKNIVPFEQAKPPFWRLNYPGKQILFSAYHMRRENLPYYIEALNKYRPPWIQGYPSLLNIVAEYILETEQLEYQPKVVTIGSESLLSHQKIKIEAAFKAQCRQHYGLTEATANISECPEGNLHVDEDFGYLEFIENQYGHKEIISTGFNNKAFVLLRYNTGDVATLPISAERCPCGRSGGVVSDIDGRIEDYIVTMDNRRVGRLDHIVKDMVNIKECQIIQEKINRIVIKIVKAPNYTGNDENKLIRETKKRVGQDMHVVPAYVDSLERSKTGKLRFVISKL